MKPGDTIYVKDGKSIICCGRITGPYRFDAKRKIIGPRGKDDLYPHQVPVAWETDFVPLSIVLGADQWTVLKLTGERLRRLEKAIGRASHKSETQKKSYQDAVLEALEGDTHRVEVRFRKRNRALIDAKKMESNGACTVCQFNFVARYVGLKRDCLVAHHVKPIGKRKKATKTTLDDIDLLCPNCHAAVHTKDPPITAADLRKMLAE
jgi:predicted HNH restriction endonuclease